MQFAHCFGTALREVRKEKEVSQKELALALDTASSALSRWETGTACPNLNTAMDLAEALDVPLVVLVERAVVMWEALEKEHDD